jgi:hypothetical protein
VKYALLFLLVVAASFWVIYIAKKTDRAVISKWASRLVVPAVMGLAVVSALLLINLNFSTKVI